MKLRTGTAFVIMIVLVVGAVFFGAYRGWTQERARVEDTSAGLETMLRTRVESAYNVLAVAARHLPESDETLQRVISDRDALERESATLPEKGAANDALTRDVAALLEKLSGMGSVRQDSRDWGYVSGYLPQMMEQSEEKTVGANYNTAAQEYNRNFKNTFSGMLARLMGIHAAEEFKAQ